MTIEAVSAHQDPSLLELPSGGVLHVAGARTGPPVLLLHGVGGGAWSWEPQRLALGGAFRTFSWEARGHGAARAVHDAGLADYYTDAQEALSAASGGSSRKVFVAGHSMGGLLAIALACDRPGDVAGLYLLDPVYSDGKSDAYGHFLPAFGRIARWLCTPLLRSFERDGKSSRAIARWLFEQAFEDRDRMEAAWVKQRRQIPIEFPRMLRESFVRPVGFELRDFAGEICVPTALVECRHPGGRPRFPELAKRLNERVGDRFTHESIAGGHYLQLDRPDDVNASFERFLTRACRVQGIGIG